MTIKDKIDADLKSALLQGDKVLVTTLRGLKSAILYEEVAKGARDQGLDDEKIIEILTKESKKRQESADLYERGGNKKKAQDEMQEREVIAKYLPEQLSDEELDSIVKEVVDSLDTKDVSQMGRAIGEVKKRVGSKAEGGRIAGSVKSKLGGAQ